MSEERYREALEEVKRTLEEGQPAIVCTVWSATSPAETLLDYVCRALDAPKIEAALAAGPPPSQHREPIEADREAAADFVKWQQKATEEWQRTDGGAIQFFADGFSRGIRQGIWDDHPVVQAFMRHRLAFSTPAASDAAQMREACAKVAEAELMLSYDGYDLTGFHGENTRCRAIAKAIRALPLPATPSTEGRKGEERTDG